MKSSNEVEICYEDLCITAKDKNAKVITQATVFALICLGIGAIYSSIK